ncbi:fimbrial protein [Burkholderia pyrrocinia]|uniref:Fimbrial protein n=1 Tax=Burkholderia pyrrocinia TaxID=60550 RepID=A0ABZ3BN67_BURPY
MKKKLIASGFIVAATMHGVAVAADGTINFRGVITGAACSVVPSSQNMTVPLGIVSTNMLTAPGAKSTPAEFRVQLVGCDLSTATNAVIKFQGTPNEQEAGLLKVGVGSASAATGVGVGIADARSGGEIKLGDSASIKLAAGTTNLDFQAYYKVAAGVKAVTPGDANAVAQFMITYN